MTDARRPCATVTRAGVGAERVASRRRCSKVRGEFAYSCDLWADGMLWGVTLRSPHPLGADRAIDTARRSPLPGVYAVLTRTTYRASKRYGLEVDDQPVLAAEVVRYQGEPVALVAAEHPETARRAAAASSSTTRCSCRSPTRRLEPGAPALPGSAGRAVPGGRAPAPARQPGPAPEDPQGDPDAPTRRRRGRGEYEVGMQDQAFLGPESGLAVPAEDGGVDLFVATQWLHVDQRADPPRARPAAGEGAADPGRRRRRLRRPRGPLDAGARLPARAAHRQAGQDGLQPRGVVLRPRAPAPGAHALRARRHPRRRAGLRHGAQIVLDGGAYASSTRGRGRQRRPRWASGRTSCRTSAMDCYGAYTNNPPCGAMRGFGAVQAAFAYESQMDKLAEALGHGPGRAADAATRSSEGSAAPTGQVIDAPRRSPSCCAGCARCRCRRRTADRRPAPSARRRRATPPTARASGAASATRVGIQEHRLLRGLRRLLDGAGAARGRRRRAGRHRAHRGRRGRPGARHRAGSRSPAPSSASSGWSSRPADTAVGIGRLDVGVAADLRDRRRRQGRLRGVRGGARAGRGAGAGDGGRAAPGGRS